MNHVAVASINKLDDDDMDIWNFVSMRLSVPLMRQHLLSMRPSYPDGVSIPFFFLLPSSNESSC